ncbi:solute carrier family 41 member 1-like [Bacillus rossius redtenbacheri]|uniref:solute carrier family 41 member 1-like n=1 Tax=Bacillus rossius redtenbacheri TaxID=93214 RepID=UPI002FDC8944
MPRKTSFQDRYESGISSDFKGPIFAAELHAPSGFPADLGAKLSQDSALCKAHFSPYLEDSNRARIYMWNSVQMYRLQILVTNSQPPLQIDIEEQAVRICSGPTKYVSWLTYQSMLAVELDTAPRGEYSPLVVTPKPKIEVWTQTAPPQPAPELRHSSCQTDPAVRSRHQWCQTPAPAKCQETGTQAAVVTAQKSTSAALHVAQDYSPLLPPLVASAATQTAPKAASAAGKSARQPAQEQPSQRPQDHRAPWHFVVLRGGRGAGAPAEEVDAALRSAGHKPTRYYLLVVGTAIDRRRRASRTADSRRVVAPERAWTPATGAATRTPTRRTDPALAAEETRLLAVGPSSREEGDDMGPGCENKLAFPLADVEEAADDANLPDLVLKLDRTPSPPEESSRSTPPTAAPVATPVETHCSIGCQVVAPFFIAGMGMVSAGIFLEHVQNWKVFEEVPEIIILVPALLGLKGNLEMTLASRLSTEANLGHMDDSREQWSMILGNLTLVQCQAIVVGMMSAMVAVLMVAISRQEFDFSHTLLLCSCSIITSSIASLILGLITAAVIVLSHWLHVNPDNVATPIAASLGDITSLALLSWVATLLYEVAGKSSWISKVVIVCYTLAIPFWVWVARKNKYTKSALYTGWTPVIMAMLISTFGGFILDIMMSKYKGVAAFQPVINGVGGNLVSVQASRLSTALHQHGPLGTLPPDTKVCVSPIHAFFSSSHLVFAYAISYFQRGDVSLTPVFMCFYLIAAFVQVAVLLYIAYVLTYLLWRRGIEPDNSTIPYLTSLGDLLGIVLLGITFALLRAMGESTD